MEVLVATGNRHKLREIRHILGAGFKVLGSTAGGAICQILGEDRPETWKNNDHLVWLGAKPGDTLDLLLPVEKTGTYKVRVALTKAPWNGIIQLSIDDKKIADPIDLYDPGVVPTGPRARAID